ncbi:YadA-like family protein [Lysobacter gummosus]|uniref:YadA-like family protein n=1 Tax=Lysobacter gummosus TaxID=262324 RepID=A0ABY3XHV5_9GAMM|nr:YadA-like family protein [Lysobacter gummosus]ALN90760.1 yadA-like C-terminal region family protein [Lysobacter gummosus]UNP31232.1 YadA-like family protein [Lysobacter gummosus]
MNTLHKTLIAAALTLATSSVWAGEACVLDDGAGNTGTEGATATGANAVACGTGATASGDSSSAIGVGSIASGTGASAIGSGSTASGEQSSAIGAGATASADFSSAYGMGSTASGAGALVVGVGGTASGDQSAAFGTGANATGANSNAIGDGSTASADFATAVGSSSTASGQFSLAGGAGSSASGVNSVALGAQSSTTADNAVALGSNSVADRANTVSFGAVGNERQLVNVAAATQDTDAVNLSQLNTLSGALGGGASFGGGVFTPPTYVIQGSSFNDVGSAFGAVDGRLTDLYGRIAAIPAGPQGPVGPQGPQGPQGAAGTGGSALSANYTDASKTQLALEGAGGTRVSNVANGTAATDAANVGQVQAGDAQTLRSANTYTDSRVAQMLAAPTEAVNRLRDDMNWRFAKQDERIDKMGAMTAAMVQMSASASGLRTQNRVAVGAGFQGGEQALSIGYQRAISDRATVTVGGAFSDSESSVGVGAGFGW